MYELNLPNVTIEKQYPDNTALFVLGGRKPSAKWLGVIDFQSETVAADKGIESCFDADIIPSLLIGDADSADEKAWQWACRTEGTEVLKFDKDKDYTDFQLALSEFSKKHEGKNYGVFLTGCWGGRFDHLWSIVISFINAKNIEPVGMADEKEGMIFLKGSSEAVLNFVEIPDNVSLFCLSKKCQGVSISGTKWELSDVQMKFEDANFISNRLKLDSSSVKVSVKNGLIGLYWNME